ncbi:MAG TPA: M1 family aminopeptidase [Polyangiaceae bacterium]|nr:M1 family aminopeptidase [Polyangiaceae bacterium]
MSTTFRGIPRLVLFAFFPCAAWVAACDEPDALTPVQAMALPEPPAIPLGPAVVPLPRDDGRLPGGVNPFSYRLRLRLDPRADRFAGHVEIDVDVEEPTRAIVLHGRGFKIDSVVVQSAEGKKIAATATSRAALGSKGEPEELVVTTAEPLHDGPATLVIDYEAPYASRLRGIYKVVEPNGAYVFSQFEPTDARQAFPCFDEPSYKTPFTISVTTPDGNVAFTNTPEETRHAADPGFTTFQFQSSLPLPTYLVAVAVGPLEVLPGATEPTPLRLIATQGRSHLGALALETAAQQLPLLEKYFRSPYPYAKLDFAAVPNFSAGAMENPGLITFREERLLVDPATASVGSRVSLYGVLAHEMSHLWFGDLVTMSWWDDLWLNEGFATWSATRTLDEWRPELGAGEDAVADTGRAMRGDTLSTSRRIREPVRSTTEALEAFDGITYQKAAAVLAMTEAWLGKPVFQTGIVAYLTEHRWGNGTAEDLFASLEDASKKDVTSVMYGFTEQTGVPSIDAEIACNDHHPSLHFAEHEYAPLGATAGPRKFWKVPVCVRFGDGAHDGNVCTLLDTPEKTVPLEGAACPTWLYPNVDEAGYYHANIPLPMLERLAALPAGKLSARERLGLLIEARALVDSGKLDVADFLRVAEKFRGDLDHTALGELGDFVDFLFTDLVPAVGEASFQRWVRAQFGPAARSLGWVRRPKDHENDEMARRTALAVLGDAGGDPGVLAIATTFARAWLEHPKTVDGDTASIAVPLAAIHGDAALFDAFLRRLGAPATPEERVLAITGLASFTDPALVDRTLGLLLDGTIRAQDQIYVVRRLFRRPKVRERAFAFIAAHIDALLPKLPSQMASRMVSIVSRACSPEEVDRAEALFRPRLASLEGADRALNQSIEIGRRCIAFKARHEAPFAKRLGVKPRADVPDAAKVAKPR